ncbi:GNAT family N-acetyltransferase [Salinithrix halophila]|uniref:GNAT family N-acetyltransferase n=1 Tax=Salinithrix halophila TaxID=1485204 RepID=A0ABV8JHV5_9BACL
MQIRPVRESDLSEIQKVARKAWLHTYRGILPKESILKFISHAYSLDNLRKAWKKDCNKPQRQFYVATENNRIVGYGEMVEREPGKYELTRIYILPEFQGRGIGKRLLNQLMETADPLQCMFAWVEKENISGRSFYQSMDFHAEEEVEDNFFGTVTKLLKYVRNW